MEDEFDNLPRGTVIVGSFTQGREPFYTGTITRVNVEDPRKPRFVVECAGRGEAGGIRWFFPVEIVTANGLDRKQYVEHYGGQPAPRSKRERPMRLRPVADMPEFLIPERVIRNLEAIVRGDIRAQDIPLAAAAVNEVNPEEEF